jgi:hypothetical protein
VFKKTGTLWEYYAPESAEPGFMARKDFVGWTGLPPIAGLIEYIFGIRSDYAEKKLTIDVTLLDGYGIERYPWGETEQLDIKVAKRKKASDKPRVTIKTSSDIEVTLLWGEGDNPKKITKRIKPGNNII